MTSSALLSSEAELPSSPEEVCGVDQILSTYILEARLDLHLSGYMYIGFMNKGRPV